MVGKGLRFFDPNAAAPPLTPLNDDTSIYTTAASAEVARAPVTTPIARHALAARDLLLRGCRLKNRLADLSLNAGVFIVVFIVFCRIRSVSLDPFALMAFLGEWKIE